jgi:hypothetical protein
MAVSRGPISDIGRIWADGRLLRREDGVFLEDTVFRVHSKGQAEPDPLISAAEGETLVPAYRHLSYVVFEGLDLGPFGNRIPSLSFEVLADEGRVLDWLEELTAPLGARLIGGSAGPAVSGFTAWLDPAGDDIATLLGAAGARSGSRDGRLAIVATPTLVGVSVDDIIHDGPDAEEPGRLTQDPRPSGLGLSFSDSERDYQLGWQQEVRGGRGEAASLSWPLASSASTARAIAARLLQEADAGAERLSVTLPHRFLTVSVGDHVRFGDEVSWEITGRDIRGISVRVELRRVAASLFSGAIPTDPGRVLEGPAQAAPPTVAVVIEPPMPITASVIAGSLLIVASGGDGWRGAEVSLLEGGEEVPVGTVAQLQPFGILMTEIAGAPTTIWDERTSLVLDVSAGTGLFQTRSARAILDGGGLLSVGEELIQYREAHSTGPGTVRLTGLLRGRFGTPSGAASVGTLVMSVSRTGWAPIQMEAEALGRELPILVAGAGDPVGGSLLVHRMVGAAWAPFAPVHVQTDRLPDGTLVSSWVGRHRANWRWEIAETDGSDTYVAHIRNAVGVTRKVAGDATGLRLEPDRQIAMFGSVLAAAEMRVEAVGDGPEMLRFTPWVSI